MIARFTTATLLAITALTASATIAAADTRHHLDEIACRLARDTDTLVQEAAIHYRHTPQYPHLISDAVQMKRLANHIHAIVLHGSIDYLKRDVDDLDRLFHHVEGLIHQIEVNSRHSFHGGHIHGNTFHVCRGLKLIEADIHHLQNDLRILCRTAPVHQTFVQPQVYNKPVFVGGNNGFGNSGHGHGGHGHGGPSKRGGQGGFNRGGSGIQIQRGNVTFQFGF